MLRLSSSMKTVGEKYLHFLYLAYIFFENKSVYWEEWEFRFCLSDEISGNLDSWLIEVHVHIGWEIIREREKA